VRQRAVLLVEDDRNEVDVALRAIERADLDVKVEVARDGLEALEALGIEKPVAEAAAPPPPRVVFLDLKMPRVDGWEVLRRMREDPRTASVPVVVLSRSDRAEDIARSYALGANSFLVKRYDPRGPGRYFAEAVRYWVDLNHISRRTTP
jgi:two-component system response regulator